MSPADAAWLQEALELARKGRGQSSPNPLVGAVIVRDGVVIGRGFHIYTNRKHAEILALEEAAAHSPEGARGATLYINLEPCSHQGRTPPCTDALIAAGIARVVASMEDPNPLVKGDGFRKLRAAGLTVEIDQETSSAARKLNEAFVHFMQTRRPLVTLKTALTLDGKIAAPDDNRGWITSETARAHVQGLRHECDAILTGIGTALADDPLLTDRSGLPRSHPLLRVVLDSRLRLPIESRLVASCQDDVAVVTTSAAPPEKRKALEKFGVKVLVFDGPFGRADVRSTINWLGEQRWLSVLVEAGSHLNWSVLEAQCADKIFFYYAPKILGGTQSLSMAGGIGRRRRADAIRVRDVELHPIARDEFAVEAYVVKEMNVHGDR
jgi:diaminohydroxyphosphoribosylaminopyrimidine deaminase/5-amino-6-(5-phosphoribosylamino)uracil reductase